MQAAQELQPLSWYSPMVHVIQMTCMLYDIAASLLVRTVVASLHVTTLE